MDSSDPLRTHRLAFTITAAIGLTTMVVAPLLLLIDVEWAPGAAMLLSAFQGVVALVTLGGGVALVVRQRRANQSTTSGGVVTAAGALALTSSAVVGAGAAMMAAIGAAWGRPLRVQGVQRHPELQRGDDWTRGDRPSCEGLDAPTRTALEALWLHDAQKEHASVPAFSRVGWLLAAAGADAKLLDRTLVAAREEIDHAERCFALAAGYGNRSHTVLPMPELLLEGSLAVNGNALVTLAVESLNDGCLLEDFNADVAARCASVCEEPVTRDVLERIAREERSHAELSWSILEFALARDVGGPVERAVREAIARLETYPRPTAVSPVTAPLVAAADARALRAHGRIADGEWAELFAARIDVTRTRATSLLVTLAPAQAA